MTSEDKVITGANGEKYFDMTPTDDGYKSMLLLFRQSIKSHEDDLAQLDRLEFSEEHIDDDADAFASSDSPFEKAIATLEFEYDFDVGSLLSDCFEAYRNKKTADIRGLKASCDEITRYFDVKGVSYE